MEWCLVVSPMFCLLLPPLPALLLTEKLGWRFAYCYCHIGTWIRIHQAKPLPLMLDQYPESGNRVKVLKSGEKVIVDREKTLESITLVFYWSINIGAFFQLATSYCARRVGFWLAFFVPLVLYLFMPLAFWWVKPKLVFEKPSGSILGVVLKILVVSFSGNFIKRIFDGTFWEYAKPSVMKARGREYFKREPRSIGPTNMFSTLNKHWMPVSCLFTLFL